MIYLAFIVACLASVFVGYKLGVYSQTLWMNVVYMKVVEEIMIKHNIDKKELTANIKEVANKFNTGEYSVSDIYRNSSR